MNELAIELDLEGP
jgi:hypothetical protein